MPLKQYVSVLVMAKLPVDSAPSPRDIKLARQRLLAEFDLTGEATINAEGAELTRNDVINLFAQLEQPVELEYHLLVASDKVLLHFLTRHEILPEERFHLIIEELSPEFISWISPCFGHAFYKAAGRIYTKVSEAECRALFANSWLMTKSDTWDSWGGVATRLSLMQKNLKHINMTALVSPAHIDIYTDKKFIHMLSLLPDDRFGEQLNDYAFEMMQLAIKEFNNRHFDYAINILAMARTLRVSEELLMVLLAKEREMESLLGNNVHAEKPWLLTRIVVGIFLLLLLLSALSC